MIQVAGDVDGHLVHLSKVASPGSNREASRTKCGSRNALEHMRRNVVPPIPSAEASAGKPHGFKTVCYLLWHPRI